MAKAKENPRSIKTARKDYARQWHAANEGRGSPESAGKWIHQMMVEEYGKEYASELAQADCTKEAESVQEAAWVAARQGGDDLLGDSFLEAPVKDVDGCFVKAKNTTAEFHDYEREKQILNLRRVNNSFDRDEQRRELLKEGGLWDTEGMTTEQAAWKYRTVNK